ncbi:MAG: very short patch repair endonuclease [Clostridia bacterium]|nr:very short patch repair endonuclease [Clostridia bacterium]
MSDIFDKKKRFEIMSSVRSQNNKSTELRLIKLFKELDIKGWRRNYKVEGKPDFVFLEKKIAVFVDGCFWHGHDCRNVSPADNLDYWENKRKRNKLRDFQINERFESRGWTIIRIWECELTKKKQEQAISKLRVLLHNVN